MFFTLLPFFDCHLLLGDDLHHNDTYLHVCSFFFRYSLEIMVDCQDITKTGSLIISILTCIFMYFIEFSIVTGENLVIVKSCMCIYWGRGRYIFKTILQP